MGSNGGREAKWDREDGPGENKLVFNLITGAVQPRTLSAVPGYPSGHRCTATAAEGCGLHVEEVRSGLAETAEWSKVSQRFAALTLLPPYQLLTQGFRRASYSTAMAFPYFPSPAF